MRQYSSTNDYVTSKQLQTALLQMKQKLSIYNNYKLLQITMMAAITSVFMRFLIIETLNSEFCV